MRGSESRTRLLAEWAGYLQRAAAQGAITGKPIRLSAVGIAGPRAGALELYAGEHAPKVLHRLSGNDAALLRQFVPWQFPGEPSAYMAGRNIRVEAGWPEDLSETMIRLSDLSKKPERGGRWVTGKNEMGATVIAALDNRTPHWLVSGATGSGKSVTLRSAVLQLAADQDNRLVLVDGKFGEGLGGLAHLPGIVGPVACDGPQARAALTWTATEMRRRYESADRRGRLVLVIDEFQEFVADPVFVDLFRKVAAQGRAAGVHLLAGTQHPTIDAFGDPATRRNLVGKLALRVSDPDASRVAIGAATPRADYLLGAGDAYAVGPGAVHRIQAAYVDGKDVDQAGAGAWDFETWDGAEAGDIGQELPTGERPGFAKSYTVPETGIALMCAVDGAGRPAMLERLDAEGIARPGSDRAYKLHRYGKDLLAWLEERRYFVGLLDND